MNNRNLKSMEQAQTAKRQSLAEWRKAQVHELSLPSGLTVKVRNVTMTDLALTGMLPPAILEMVDDAQKSGQEIDLKQIVKNMVDFRKVLDALVTIALVEPLIGETPDDTHITLDELPNNDKMEIYNWVNREATQLTPFREGENQPVAAA